MNKIIFCLVSSALILSTASLFAQKESKGKSKEQKLILKDQKDSISYALGLDIAQNIRKSNIEVNEDPFHQGLRDAFAGKDSILFTTDMKKQVLTRWQMENRKKAEEKKLKETEENKKKAAEFLAQNKKNPGIIELPDGIQYKVLQEGKGTPPTAKDQVKVMYEGKLLDGTIFDSSYKRNQHAVFNVGGLIKGWTELLQLMSPGSIWEAYIPSELGYGDKGTPNIPGGSLLIFKIELMEVVPAK